mmetsp:Transcript_4660/g.9310  ORF Transcript_4660/g.9310 Transcript_4660/m.9310 type:complete len:252 (-) Transcript_4660:306-1061(-)
MCFAHLILWSWGFVHLLHCGLCCFCQLGILVGGHQMVNVALHIIILALKISVDTVKEMIRSRSCRWHGKPCRRKHVLCPQCVSKVDGVSSSKQAKLVKQLERFGRRLMNHSDNGPASFCQSPHTCHHMVRSSRIQSRRRLIQKQQGGRCHQLAPNGHTPPLPSRHTSDVPVANIRVLYRLQTQLLDDRIHNLFLLARRHGHGQPQPRSKQERLLHRQCPNQHLILRHVRSSPITQLTLMSIHTNLTIPRCR